MTVVAYLQARMSSNRLPGKVLSDVVGEPMIIRQIDRIRRSTLIDDVVVLTSTDTTDDPLSARLELINQQVMRGDLNNVFSRFHDAIDLFPCKVALRLTADCPLIDPEVIDRTIESHLESGADYTSNSLKRTFPRGLDCEVFRPEVIKRLYEEDLTPEELEHVTLGIYRRPDLFTLNNYENSTDESHRRWTVDYPVDLDFVRFVFENLLPTNDQFSSDEIRLLLKRYPNKENLESLG